MNPTRVHTTETIETRIHLLKDLKPTPADKLEMIRSDLQYLEYVAEYDNQPAMPEHIYYWERICPLGNNYRRN